MTVARSLHLNLDDAWPDLDGFETLDVRDWGPKLRYHGRRNEVDAFYEAAMAAGGTDNGAPGVRPHYHPNYYCAFVLDPDGYNIEAVCHEPV